MQNFRSSYLAEAIVMVAGAGLFVGSAIRYQYIYQVVSEAHNFTSNKSFDYCSVDYNASSSEKTIVANEASRWQLYMILASSIPAIFSSIILTSWSDKVGRKVALFFPLFGYAVGNLMQLLVIMYSLPLYMLVISSALVGLGGSFTGMLNITMAYISDITTKEEKLKRFAYLECGMGLGGGLVSFGCGFWITSQGFIPSSWLTAGCSCTAVLLVPLLPSPKSLKLKQYLANVNHEDNTTVSNQHNDCVLLGATKESNHASSFTSRLKLIWKVYTYEKGSCYLCNTDDGQQPVDCPHGTVALRGRVWRILAYLLAFNIYLYPIMGNSATDTMFFVSYPLCFSPGAMGIRTAILYGSFAFGPPLIAFSKSVLKWRNVTILVITVITSIGVDIAFAFVTKTNVVYAVSAVTVISRLAPPVMRAQISSLASASEQGAALGLISGMESLTSVIGNVTYLIIYPATLHIIRGFIYLYSATILLLPLSIVIFIWIADKRRDSRLMTSTGYSLLIPS